MTGAPSFSWTRKFDVQRPTSNVQRYNGPIDGSTDCNCVKNPPFKLQSSMTACEGSVGLYRHSDSKTPIVQRKRIADRPYPRPSNSSPSRTYGANLKARYNVRFITPNLICVRLNSKKKKGKKGGSKNPVKKEKNSNATGGCL